MTDTSPTWSLPGPYKSQRRRVFNGGPAPDPLGAVCEQLAASLRDWPIRQMESDMRLSDPQQIALYELAVALG
jgi:hypothetical protein